MRKNIVVSWQIFCQEAHAVTDTNQEIFNGKYISTLKTLKCLMEAEVLVLCCNLKAGMEI